LSQNLLDRSSPNFQDMYTMSSFFLSLKERCYSNQLSAGRRKLAYPPSFCALVFHNGWEEDRNVDSRVNTADDPCTSINDELWSSNP